MKIKIARSGLVEKILVAVGLVLFITCCGIYVQQRRANHTANAVAQKEVDLANAGKPSPAASTIKPTLNSLQSYTVPATHPRYLMIPALGVDARILPVGLTAAQAIDTPSNVYDTAWYNASSLPGQPGATLIDGHVSSWTTHGVFYSLKNLKSGDQIKVQLGNGKVISYNVVKTQTYTTSGLTADNLLTPADPSRPGLNLVTCTGDVTAGTNSFNERIVVFAEQV